MTPEIIHSLKKHVVGMYVPMQRYETHKIKTLWQQFAPRKHKLANLVNNTSIAMQTFSLNEKGQPESTFNMWACVEVSELSNIPNDMEGFTIPEGKYLKVLHKGMDASATYHKIISEWLPNSGYAIDDRPHFQVMGEKYKNGSPDSEEDFYIPIKSI
ncbi:MAG: hypothetical protein Tsb0033_25370 [Winogradskyella sp.]